ncbi:MAG: hypothetical protein EA361_13250, partial [Bacteroidetes bacterium]
MNEKLQVIYREKFEILTPRLHEYNEKVGFKNKATNPFLLKVPDNYDSFKNRIMIFGQETNTWCKECGNKSAFSNNLDKSIQLYENFYLNGGIKKYRGPFWNEFKRIKKQVSKTENA